MSWTRYRLEIFCLFGYGPSLEYRNICLSFVTKKNFSGVFIYYFPQYIALRKINMWFTIDQLLCKIYWLNTIPKHAAFLWTISSWLASRFKDLQLLSKLEIVKWEGRQQWPMKILLELPLVPIIEFSIFFVKIFLPQAGKFSSLWLGSLIGVP